MAVHIGVGDANAWLESTKLALTDINVDLEGQVSSQVFGQLASQFDTSKWIDTNTTPELVRSIIAMNYVAWTYDKTYSDDAEANAYADLLRKTAQANINAILAGTMTMPDAVAIEGVDATEPVFFPNDASSANDPSSDFPSDGGPAFLMGTVF